MPRLTYIGQTPTEGTGSPVILLRHLQRLAAHGWEITIVGEHGQDSTACDRAGWKVLQLPLRRPWWPPFRNDRSLSRKLRTWLLGRECGNLVADTPPDAVLGYLAAHSDFFPEIAAHFAKQSGKPLSLLIHDDAAAFARNEAEKITLRARHNWILRQTHRNWFVSPELAAEYEVEASNRGVLLPIPEGWTKPASWQASFSVQPKVYYAGFIWPPQYPLLAQIARALQAAGAQLVLLTKDSPELRAFLASEPADWVQPFPGNREALQHLLDNAAGLIVSYSESVAEMPWIATSFPSKFIEYAHLGLPCTVVAPLDSSIGRWAARESYPHFYTAAEPAALSSWAGGLRRQATWQASAAAVQKLARGQFNPETIHRQLEEGLLR